MKFTSKVTGNLQPVSSGLNFLSHKNVFANLNRTEKGCCHITFWLRNEN